jgi:hypothetical protein
MADRARWCAVEDAAHGRGATAGNTRFLLDKVGLATLGQIVEMRALNVESGSIAPVAAHDHFANERVIGSTLGKVGDRAASTVSLAGC